MIKVAITDDHPVTRKGVERVLDDEMGIQVISEASNGGELLSNISSELPDIAVLDLSMPDESGLDLLKEMKKQFPEVPVLILSLHPAKRYAVRCLKGGASGYLEKVNTSDELVKAIRHIVNRKQKYITEDVANLLAENIDTRIKTRNHGALHKELSDREFTVLRLIAEGRNAKSIAEKLHLSPHTIQTYRTRIKEKMQLNSDVEMTRYAIEHELI